MANWFFFCHCWRLLFAPSIMMPNNFCSLPGIAFQFLKLIKSNQLLAECWLCMKWKSAWMRTPIPSVVLEITGTAPVMWRHSTKKFDFMQLVKLAWASLQLAHLSSWWGRKYKQKNIFINQLNTNSNTKVFYVTPRIRCCCCWLDIAWHSYWIYIPNAPCPIWCWQYFCFGNI